MTSPLTTTTGTYTKTLEITTEDCTATCEFLDDVWVCKIRQNGSPDLVLHEACWEDVSVATRWVLGVLCPDHVKEKLSVHSPELRSAILETVRLSPREGVSVDNLALSVSYSKSCPIAEVHATIAVLTAPQGPLVATFRLGRCDLVGLREDPR